MAGVGDWGNECMFTVGPPDVNDNERPGISVLAYM